MTIRILLADDQPLLRQGFGMILGAQEDMEIVGEAADGRQAIQLAGRHLPDVVLMDVRMPVMNGIEATREITDQIRATKVIILTTFDLDSYAFEGLRAGASGFLLKNARPEELIAGIRAVASGEAVLAPSTTRRLIDTYAGRFDARDRDQPEGRADVLAALTPREHDVFAALAAGQTNAEIARRLVLSETTVKTHVVRILAKLDLRDRVHAVIFAYQHGLADSSPADRSPVAPSDRPG